MGVPRLFRGRGLDRERKGAVETTARRVGELLSARGRPDRLDAGVRPTV